MKEGEDPSGELDTASFSGCDIEFTSSVDKLKEANFLLLPSLLLSTSTIFRI